MDRKKIENAIKEIILAIGEDPDRPGLKNTPQRVAEMYEEIFSGSYKEAADLLSDTHELEHDEMIIIKEI